MKIDAARFGYTGTLSQPFVDFARRRWVSATLYKGDERRREHRHPMMLPVLMVPVDRDQQPLGEPVEAITRDVSSTSVGLFHELPLEHPLWAVHLSLAGTDVDLLVAVMWTRPMGPFHGSAANYLCKLTQFPIEIP